MNVNAPIMDMSMNPNGYHQPYIQQNMMAPQSQQHSGQQQHHNESPSNMSVGPPQQQQQQPPPAHPNQSQSLVNSGGGNSSQGGGGNSSDGLGSGFQIEVKTEGGSMQQRADGSMKKKTWPRKKVYKKPDPNTPKQRRFSGIYLH